MNKLRACLRGSGVPQIGEVTCGGSPQLSCKRDQIKMRDYMDRWVTPPKRVTSPTWGPPPPYKQALTYRNWSNRHPGRLFDKEAFIREAQAWKYPGSRGPFSKYLVWNKLCLRFDKALGARSRSISISKKYPLCLREGVYSMICGTQYTLLAVNCRSLQLSNRERYWCHKVCVTTCEANSWTR